MTVVIGTVVFPNTHIVCELSITFSATTTCGGEVTSSFYKSRWPKYSMLKFKTITSQIFRKTVWLKSVANYERKSKQIYLLSRLYFTATSVLSPIHTTEVSRLINLVSWGARATNFTPGEYFRFLVYVVIVPSWKYDVSFPECYGETKCVEMKMSN